ncbi:hypothetical protein BC835DRAFT_674574 [Cytidiella melzeri]|nr:hypothetical protein BC835DRAFT_674574 [Cytidiella melzeri]
MVTSRGELVAIYPVGQLHTVPLALEEVRMMGGSLAALCRCHSRMLSELESARRCECRGALYALHWQNTRAYHHGPSGMGFFKEVRAGQGATVDSQDPDMVFWRRPPASREVRLHADISDLPFASRPPSSQPPCSPMYSLHRPDGCHTSHLPPSLSADWMYVHTGASRPSRHSLILPS